MAENVDIKKVQDKLLLWEQCENSLAPLSSSQRHAVLEIAEDINKCFGRRHVSIDLQSLSINTERQEKSSGKDGDISKSINSIAQGSIKIETTQQFLTWYSQVEDELLDEEDEVFLQYFQQLHSWRTECAALLEQVEAALGDLTQLTEQYQSVSERTSSLHRVSEQLLAEQTQLHSLSDDVSQRLHYFTLLEGLSHRLASPTLSAASDQFYDLLEQLDSCMQYMSSHSKWREAGAYLIKYRHCLTRALGLARGYVLGALQHATQQVLAPRHGSANLLPSDQVLALCYGKFQASATRLKSLLSRIEDRCERSPEHEQLLADCLQCYFEQRDLLLAASVRESVAELARTHHGDHCSLVRSGCAFLVHVCHDEHQLFFQFFSKPAPQLTAFLESLCTSLYDMLRPIIIHINHLETLAEVCSILRLEMLEEHVQNNPGPLEAFGRIAWQLLQDVQERLVFRTHLYLQSDILNYKPAPGDLAYPEKLEMMESIAQQLQEQAAQQALRRVESHSSLHSVGSATSQEVAHLTTENTPEQPRSRTGNSPADLHGMWYPTVRRTLVCLSRLYRCVDRPIFQGLSQEALSMCVQSVAAASQAISARKGEVDGYLFQVKHLLILREQIAPFQVDFTIKETSLDFSKVKSAAFGLLQRRSRLLTLSTDNALLEFLLAGTPAVREQLLDSRKDVDRTLKQACEAFIRHASNVLAQPLLVFLDKVQVFLKGSSGPQESMTLVQQPFANPTAIGQIVVETQRLVKSRLPGLQRSMQLYLANRETEFVLFRPIKNAVVGAFAQLQQLLMSGPYTAEDLMLAACPSPEQVALLLSSAALAASTAPSPYLQQTQTQQQTQPQVQQQTQPQAQQQTQTQQQMQIQQQTKPEAQQQTQPQAQPQTQAQMQSLTQPQTQPQAQSQTLPHTQPQSQMKAQPQTQMQPQPPASELPQAQPPHTLPPLQSQSLQSPGPVTHGSPATSGAKSSVVQA